MKKFFIIPFLFSGLVQAQPLQETIHDMTATAPVLQGAWWAGTAGYPGGEVLFSVNESQRMAPASTLKLITSAAVLETFGPDYQFETRLYADALPNEDGVLNGNIYIRGGGDPSLGSTRPQGGINAKKLMRTWAKAIQKSGIKTIRGNIYADEICFALGLHPQTRVSRMRKKDFVRLVNEMRRILSGAIAAGGTTIRSYTSSLGVDGRFQLKLKVHSRKGQPCPLCAQEIKKIVVGGRGTYLCTHCQKKR